MDNFETTQGTGVDDWDDSTEAKNTDSTNGFIDKEAKDGWFSVVNQMPKLLKELESNLPFTVLLVSIIGYIVIASFGQMDSTGKYAGYIIFLLLMFFGYKALKENVLIIFINQIFKRKFILLILLVISITFICFQNFNSISMSFDQVKNYIKAHQKTL